MSGIKIKRFGGMNLSVATRNAEQDVAQIAHNCLLWDGALRPLAKWQSKQGGLVNRYTLKFDGTNLYTINLEKAIQLKDLTYQPNMVIGLNPSVINSDRSNIGYQNNAVNIDAIVEVGVAQPVMLPQSSITWTPEYQSIKPVNRLYGCTFVKNNGGKLEESPLTIFPGQDPTAQYFEGDSAWVLARPQSANIRENCYLRLYRSMSGMSDGQGLDNKADTDWYLCAEIKSYVAYNAGQGREYSYVDSGSVTTKPLDRYLAARFYPPPANTYNFLLNTEGGWIVAGASNGDVIISERHMTHAWPTENYVHVPATITSMASHYDTVFIGTDDRPYVLSLAMGEAGLQTNVIMGQEVYRCLANTMSETPSGAIYASTAGLISMSQEGMRVLTSSMTVSTYPLYHAEYLDTTNANALTCVDVNFSDTTYGTYHQGIYFGFCNVLINGGSYLPIGYLYETGSTLDGDRPFARLSTFDYESPGILSHAWTDNGLAVLDNSGSVWEMAFPNRVNKTAYETAPKLTYTWKSKRYVMPGITTFAAAKILFDCGTLRFKLYVDGCCTYDTPIFSKKAFTLPPSIVGVEYEIELEGTANVYEVHIATSMQELTGIGLMAHYREESPP